MNDGTKLLITAGILVIGTGITFLGGVWLVVIGSIASTISLPFAIYYWRRFRRPTSQSHLEIEVQALAKAGELRMQQKDKNNKEQNNG